jgi:micrococcal nuclease
MITTLKAYTLIIILLIGNVIYAAQFTAKVISIKDGDTIEVLWNNKPQIIRLEHIDCPEKKQAFGYMSKQALAKLCFGKEVTIVHTNKLDRNKRLIAEIILANNLNVNLEMVSLGYAWHFKKYSTSKIYAEAELKARKNKAGLWFDKSPIAPWDWRKLPKEQKQ